VDLTKVYTNFHVFRDPCMDLCGWANSWSNGWSTSTPSSAFSTSQSSVCTEQSFTTFNVRGRRGTRAVQPSGRPTYCWPPSSGSIPHPCKISQGLLQGLPARAASRAGSRHRCRRGTGGTCWALVVSAGAPQPASPTCSQDWADVFAVSLVSEEVPLNGSITPMQQSFLDQVTQKIGTVLPTPRLNKRRAKGPPSGSHPWCSRRIAGLPMGQGQPGLSRSKKEVMRALEFAQAREQISQQNLERYSKLFL
jgi:hypothetical protein